jgi:hypothetical protein
MKGNRRVLLQLRVSRQFLFSIRNLLSLVVVPVVVHIVLGHAEARFAGFNPI